MRRSGKPTARKAINVSRITPLVKKAARAVFGEYSCYRVFRCDLDEKLSEAQKNTRESNLKIISDDALANALPGSAFKHTRWYGGEESIGYGLLDGGKLVGIQWYAYGNRYAKRRSWPLRDGEIKSVHIEVEPACSGRGLGTLLKRHSLSDLRRRGYVSVVSRVWHNNEPAIKMNKALGATQIGWFVEINPFRRARPFRLLWRSRQASHDVRDSSCELRSAEKTGTEQR